MNETEDTNKANANNATYRERVFQIVRRIPAGRVMTYGQISELLGAGYDARTIGYCMHAATEDVPWHRVINAQGACSTGRVISPAHRQQMMLEAEGVEFNQKVRCDLSIYRWTPPEAEDAVTQTDTQPSLFSE